MEWRRDAPCDYLPTGENTLGLLIIGVTCAIKFTTSYHCDVILEPSSDGRYNRLDIFDGGQTRFARDYAVRLIPPGYRVLRRSANMRGSHSRIASNNPVP